MTERIELLNVIYNPGTITLEECNTKKSKMVDEEMDRIAKEQAEMDNILSTSFHADELAREPFLKDLLRQKDLWKRHKAAVAADKESWEAAARETFISKCKSNLASPLLVMFGELLIMEEDKEEGRQKLIEILFLQDAEERTKIFNWLVLGTGPQGSEIVHGKKVEHLSYPLFSFQHPDLAQLNSHILSETSTKKHEGGSTDSTSVSKLYFEESKVLLGGSIPFPVVDAQGAPSGYFVDVEPIHNAFLGLEN